MGGSPPSFPLHSPSAAQRGKNVDAAFRRVWRAVWVCLCLGVSVLSSPAHASGSVPASAGFYCVSNNATWPGASVQSACTPYLATQDSSTTVGGCGGPHTVTVTNTFTRYDAISSGVQGTFYWTRVQDEPQCGNHFEQARSGLYFKAPDSCPSGTTSNGSGGCNCPDPSTVVNGVCTPPAPPGGSCVSQAGKQSVTNMTVGWSRTNPDVYDPTQVVGGLHVPPSNTLICDQGCQRTTGQPAGGWVSQVPAPNGLYRMSMDIVVTATGGSCDSPQPSDANSPIAPPIPCDGFMGVVNGVPKCVAPAGASASAVPLPSDTLKGNPKAGSDASKGIGDQSRQPFDGNGGNGGGPPTTNDGSKPGSSGGGGGGSSGGGSSGGGSGTGAPGGGTKGNGTDGKNTDGGTCQLNPSAAGCGGAVAGQPDLYTKKTATFETALSDFKGQVQGSALGTATGGFFNVQGGGTCPTFSAHIPYINADVNIDQFCSEFATNALALLKLALMVVAGIAAFRVAVL